MSKFYTIQKLCKLTSVSVRTLHYYDEINLLKPTHRTAKNHRLYSSHDLLQLQQIVVWKFLGFSLAQIRTLLHKNKLTILESLKIQAAALTEETLRVEKVSRCINYLITQHELQPTIDWDTVVEITEVLKLKETGNLRWYEKYLSEIELQQFKKFAKKRTQEWQALFNEVKLAINSNSSTEKQAELVGKLMSLINKAYSSHPKLKNKLMEGYKAGVIPENYFPYDKEVIAYLENALRKFQR